MNAEKSDILQAGRDAGDFKKFSRSARPADVVGEKVALLLGLNTLPPIPDNRRLEHLRETVHAKPLHVELYYSPTAKSEENPNELALAELGRPFTWKLAWKTLGSTHNPEPRKKVA